MFWEEMEARFGFSSKNCCENDIFHLMSTFGITAIVIDTNFIDQISNYDPI